MAYIEHNFFPLKVFVRNEYLYQNKKGHGEFTEGVIVSVRCMPGQADGSYYATINWGSNDMNTDLSLAEDPMEHKSHHIILLDNGQIALQPNNRIKWSEPSFVTKPFPEKPDYLVNKDYYNCEGFDKWATEDSQYMFYDTDIKE